MSHIGQLIDQGEYVIDNYVSSQNEDVREGLHEVLAHLDSTLNGETLIETLIELKWMLEYDGHVLIDKTSIPKDTLLTQVFPEVSTRDDFQTFFRVMSVFLGLIEQLYIVEDAEQEKRLTDEVLRGRQNVEKAIGASGVIEKIRESLSPLLELYPPGRVAQLEISVGGGEKEANLRVMPDNTVRICFWDLFWFLEQSNKHLDFNIPEVMSTWILDTLRYLETTWRPAYLPDEDFRADALNHTYFAAAHALALWYKQQSYSEAIRAFEESFKAYFSTHKDIGPKPMLDKPDDWEARSQVALQGIVGMHLFRIRSKELNWPEALRMYAHAMACFHAVTGAEYDEMWDVEFLQKELLGSGWRTIGNEWESYKNKMHDEAKLVFSHTRDVPPGKEWWPDASRYVQMIVTSLESEYIGRGTELSNYWSGEQGWIRGVKLEPGERLIDLNRDEDEKAYQRLRRYFFAEPQWGALPERAQKRLVEADRVWYSSRHGDPGAVLESVKIAVEEVLFDLLWKPCYHWIDESPKGLEILDLMNLRQKLQESGQNPSLLEYESMLRSKGLQSFLHTTSSSDEDRRLLRRLWKPLEALRKSRNLVAHDTGGRVLTREQVASLYRKFLGLGEQGILPRLASMKARLDKWAPIAVKHP